MHIIVGLGNPGKKYENTRHNIGFEAISALAGDYGIKLKNHSKFRAFIGEGNINGKPVLLVLPMTYMNLSGESVIKILNFYKLPPSQLIVIYDDVNLPVGDIRIRERGSSGGQKGMINIIAHTKTEEFPRVRIGVGNKPPQVSLSDYVLSRFFKQEMKDIVDGLQKTVKGVEMILQGDILGAMGTFNRKITKQEE